MKTSPELPPNYADIEGAFHPDLSRVVITYGDTVYNVKEPLSPDLMLHEQTHVEQQGDNPKAWWDKYIADPEFRLDQELEAYGKQYAFAKKIMKDRNFLYRFLFGIAADLSSSMYGRILTHGQAESKIRSAAKPYEK